MEIGDWFYFIEIGRGSFPFCYRVKSRKSGRSGPAKSFADAKRRIEEIMEENGHRIPKRQGRVPGFDK